MNRPRSDYRRSTRPTRRQNNVILIVCTGETERLYFAAFRIDLGVVRVRAVVDNRNPVTLVQKAIHEKSQAQYAQVWCVFDKDDFPDFDQAIYLARKYDMRVASSNQAFELWFIMHFRRQDGPLHRNRYGPELDRLLRRPYSKTDTTLYEILTPKIAIAIENARIGYERHKRNSLEPSVCESYTTVFKLVEELLRWRKDRLRRS